jgi:ketosteroid isomerase-like protein
MLLKNQFITYLKLYADKNISQITEMFADDVALRDWKISVFGKAAAIAETEKNFSAAITINIEPLHIYEAGNTVVGELRIIVNETEVLHVIDVITFDTDGKIKSIRAYLGRGD